jgi:hypothetical protein
MKNIWFQIFSILCLTGILVVSGCVAPPEETQAGPVDLYNPNQFTSKPTGAIPGLLADATPFETTAPPTPGYNIIVPKTPIPEDMVCLVDFAKLNMTFESNKTAKNINLVNPPMYINYSITEPYNVSGTRIVTENGVDKTIEYTYYSPYAYLEITARDPVSGEIFTQDGFGKSYGSNLNKTIQISKPGNLLIEIGGNNVTSTVGYWVKPSGNIEAGTVDVSLLECLPQNNVKRLNQ